MLHGVLEIFVANISTALLCVHYMPCLLKTQQQQQQQQQRRSCEWVVLAWRVSSVSK